MGFDDAIVLGLQLVVVIMGLVEFTKKLGLSGKALTATSMLIGVAFGVAYQISLGVPVNFQGWFGAGVYGLSLGLVASGVYDIGAKYFRS